MDVLEVVLKGVISAFGSLISFELTLSYFYRIVLRDYSVYENHRDHHLQALDCSTSDLMKAYLLTKWFYRTHPV